MFRFHWSALLRSAIEKKSWSFCPNSLKQQSSLIVFFLKWSLTILDKPVLKVLVFFFSLDAREWHGFAKRMAKFHGTKPVEFEVAIKVALVTDSVKCNRAVWPRGVLENGVAPDGHLGTVANVAWKIIEECVIIWRWSDNFLISPLVHKVKWWNIGSNATAINVTAICHNSIWIIIRIPGHKW